MKFKPVKQVGYTDPQNPEALGICDISGQVFKRKDLLPQMEWRGDSLQWTGYYVGRPFLDKPNEQGRPPHIPPDPVPVKNPRTKQPSIVTWSSGVTTTFGNLPYPTFGSFGSISDGRLAPSVPESEAQLRRINFNVS